MTATATPLQVDRDTFLTTLRAAELLTDRQFVRAVTELPATAESAQDVAGLFTPDG